MSCLHARHLEIDYMDSLGSNINETCIYYATGVTYPYHHTCRGLRTYFFFEAENSVYVLRGFCETCTN